MNGDVILVHCVDTEGPLCESFEATFQRIETTFGLKFKASLKQLKRIQMGLDVPEELKVSVMEFISDDRLNYHKSWHEVDVCIRDLMSPEWRMALSDDFGQGYIFSWFVMDHVGFETNPRRRSLGFHTIYDHYRQMLAEFSPPADKLYFHTHPVPFFFEANKTSNNFSFTNHHIQTISRRVIDYLDFPVAYRPGAHCERPDINLFLEMWVPFDYGNQGMEKRQEEEIQNDMSGGRFGDWRRATSEWEVYHPDFYDYQKKGSMKRFVARSLNLNSRIRPITKAEIKKAFQRASEGKHTIIAVTDHDEREMRPYIQEYMANVREVQKDFKDIKIRHANAVDAIRMAENLVQKEPTELNFSWSDDRLEIKADAPIWGPQPWFCFKTKDMRYIHENLDCEGDNTWSYVFDSNTILLDQIESLAIATNDEYGNTAVYRLSPDKDIIKTEMKFRNAPVTMQ